MSNDHEYALIGGVNRSSIGRWIYTMAAGISAALVFGALSLVDVAGHFGIDANFPPALFSVIGAGTVYLVLYFVFKKYMWKWPKIRKMMNVPDLSGQWKCYGSSSFDNEGDASSTTWVGIVSVSQDWDKINITLSTTKSRSESVSAALVSESVGTYRLLYHYKNDPRTFENDLNAHHGFVDIIFDSDIYEGRGIYFTGRGRSTFGQMRWERDK